MNTNEMKTTSNSSVYRKMRKHYLENIGEINCSYCRYHRGENSTGKRLKAYKAFLLRKIK